MTYPINLACLKLWREFDECFNTPRAICQDEWLAQKRAIQRIVNKEVKQAYRNAERKGRRNGKVDCANGIDC